MSLLKVGTEHLVKTTENEREKGFSLSLFISATSLNFVMLPQRQIKLSASAVAHHDKTHFAKAQPYLSWTLALVLAFTALCVLGHDSIVSKGV